jgi:methyl-accepting chemotaxis protein
LKVSIFNRLKIRAKLMVLLLLPTAAFLFLAVGGVVERIVVAQEMRNIEQLTELTERIGDFVHESQIERGFTAGFVGSGGRQFGTELRAQRSATDRVGAALDALLADFDASEFGEGFAGRLGAGHAALRQLDATRNAVDNRRISLPEAIGYYTDLHERLLDSIGEIGSLSSNTDIATRVMASFHLMKAKELAGIERATLNGAFVADAFGEGMYRRMIEVMAAQDIHTGLFLELADESLRSSFNQRMNHRSVQEAAQLRTIAVDRGEAGDFGINPARWFQVQTEKINLLRNVEQQATSDVLAQAGRLRSRANQGLILFVILAGTAFLVTAALGYFTARGITGPLDQALNAARALAQGDLTKPIHSNSRDEIGDLLKAMQEMVERLSQVVGEVNGASSSLASASEEVSSTAQSLSQGASEQAASVEETTSSVEQMAASIDQNNENARITDDMASQAAREAAEGGDSVGKTVEAMHSIAKKISIIDEIAYQTNLLALNAAIEAARAGEHGKGFAVVAAEVRKLAERSQVAAQEIGEVAKNSVGLAEQAGQLLESMVPSIQKTSELVQEISAASIEQASGARQINDAMEQLNSITQQAASSSEELASTSEEMSSQAEQMLQLMSFFKLRGGSGIIYQAPAGNPAAAGRTPGQRRSRDHNGRGNGQHKQHRAPVSREADESEFVRF